MAMNTNNNIFTLTFLFAAIAATTNFIVAVSAAVSCSSTAECERLMRVGSRCGVDGVCTNPFVDGCLKTVLGPLDDGELAEKNFAPVVIEALNGRVCNSDDKDDAIDGGDCFENEFDYFEIRVHNSNWESSIFVAWIMQIMLMEVLKVPVTIGLNSNVTAKSSFYSPVNELEYSSVAYPWDALADGADCEKTDEDCVDVMPEVWNGQASKWSESMFEGIIEPVDGCGQVGKLGWYIPGSTAKRDNTLVSYYGLQGEENRANLAQAFKRPTTWYEYCEEVSKNNCTTPDDVAEYYPESEIQAVKYFEEGLYTGHFRLLPENNCTEFPETCTGYFVGPECTWDTNVDAQIYWNDIVGLKQDGPSEPNKGYKYFSQIEIWRAANATNSDVMMWWWQPEALVQEFSNTDWSFQQIILPTVTDACYKSRIGAEDRCSEDISDRRASPLGACDDEAHALRKIISSTLEKKTLIEDEPTRSPGYPFIRALKISDIEIQAMLKQWIAIKNDKYGNDAREAVCSWVIDHMDTLLGFIPPGHPRKLDETGSFDHSYIYFALSASSLGILGILVSGCVVYQFRKTKVFVYAQVTFIFIIMLGFILVAIGGLLYALEPTDFTCMARSWLTSLGFCIVLAAVLVKMSTINRIMQSSKKLKRVRVSRKSMFGSLSFLVLIDLVFLIAWTVVSPLHASKNLFLPGEFSTTVETSTICRSSQGIWQYLLEGWHSLLLLVASVLAFQSRDIIPQFNESRSIGTMIYSQFLFMILRLIVLYLGLTLLIEPNVFGASVSLLYIFDTLFAIAIYVIPKCLEAKRDSQIYDSRSSLTNSRFSYEQSFRSSANGNSEHSGPYKRSTMSSDHGIRPFKLTSASMEVNCESEATQTNLRGRHMRRSTLIDDKLRNCEVSTSNHNNSVNEEELSISNNNESVQDTSEKTPSDSNDGLSSSGFQTKSSIVSNITPPMTNLSSHDTETEGNNEKITDDLPSRTNGDNEETVTKMEDIPSVSNDGLTSSGQDQPQGEIISSDIAYHDTQLLSSSSHSHVGKQNESQKSEIKIEQNATTLKTEESGAESPTPNNSSEPEGTTPEKEKNVPKSDEPIFQFTTSGTRFPHIAKKASKGLPSEK